MLVLNLFRCCACDRTPEPQSFPLCPQCQASLVDCPLLCSMCASPFCRRQSRCIRPWRSVGHASPIQSYSGLYLLVGPGYSVLRQWKKKGGPFLNRRVLRKSPAFLRFKEEVAQKKINQIVSIPQRFKRSMRLGRSPARAIALWLSQEMGVPYFEVLWAPQQQMTLQAGLSLQERVSHKIYFQFNPLFNRKIGGKIILIDDFMTTGKTLRSAAQVLAKGGAEEIHAFCLGVRPELCDRLFDYVTQPACTTAPCT